MVEDGEDRISELNDIMATGARHRVLEHRCCTYIYRQRYAMQFSVLQATHGKGSLNKKLPL